MVEEVSIYETTYDDVMSLYTYLKSSNLVRVVRAEFRQGECQALPIDFCADVDLKTSKALHGTERSLGGPTVELVGKVFLEYGLDKNGAYKRLYETTEGLR